MRSQGGGLPLNGAHDGRVAMAHVGHIVVDVEIGAPLGVVQPHPFATHEMQGLVVEKLGAGAQQSMPAAHVDRDGGRDPGTCRGMPAQGQ